MKTEIDSLDSIKTIVVPQNGTEKDYNDILSRLISTGNPWEIKVGFINWLKGECLNAFVASKQYKRGQLTKLRQDRGISKASAYWYRQVAKAITRDTAMTMKYSDMLDLVKGYRACPEDEDPHQESRKEPGAGAGIHPTNNRGNDKGKGRGGKGRKVKIEDGNLLRHLASVESVLLATKKFKSKDQGKPAIERYETACKTLTTIHKVSGELRVQCENAIALMSRDIPNGRKAG